MPLEGKGGGPDRSVGHGRTMGWAAGCVGALVLVLGWSRLPGLPSSGGAVSAGDEQQADCGGEEPTCGMVHRRVETLVVWLMVIGSGSFTKEPVTLSADSSCQSP